jgi:cytochrome oxidase Cu insertion factor (SCO1/SenC/PrrC family)
MLNQIQHDTSFNAFILLMVTRMLNKIIILTFILVVSAGLYVFLDDRSGARTGAVHPVIQPDKSVAGLLESMNFLQLSPGQNVPDFSLASVDGETIRLSDYSGKVVILSFWATW